MTITLAMTCACAALLPLAHAARPRLDKLATTGTLDVCIWPEYYGISFRNQKSGTVAGLDVEMARELASQLGVRLNLVDSSFARFIGDLENERCDVAMMAVGITAERSERLAFTTPYLRSDIHAVTMRNSSRIKRWEDIDRDGVRVGVTAGTYQEGLMSKRLRHADLVVVQAPASRESELEAGRIDVFMSDYPFTRKMIDNHDWVKIIDPPGAYFPVDYAYALRKGDPAWLARLDAFLARTRADGTLRSIATRYALDPIVIDPRQRLP